MLFSERGGGGGSVSLKMYKLTGGGGRSNKMYKLTEGGVTKLLPGLNMWYIYNTFILIISLTDKIEEGEGGRGGGGIYL